MAIRVHVSHTYVYQKVLESPALLKQLPSLQQEILTKRFIENKPYSTIVKELDSKMCRIKRQYTIGIMLLREITNDPSQIKLMAVEATRKADYIRGRIAELEKELEELNVE